MGIIVDDLPYSIMISQIDSDLMADDEQARDSCRRSNRDEEDFFNFLESVHNRQAERDKTSGYQRYQHDTGARQWLGDGQCTHPTESRVNGVNGSNQYGTWTKCVAWAKLDYTPYGFV